MFFHDCLNSYVEVQTMSTTITLNSNESENVLLLHSSFRNSLCCCFSRFPVLMTVNDFMRSFLQLRNQIKAILL
jgi:hypothetical protein